MSCLTCILSFSVTFVIRQIWKLSLNWSKFIWKSSCRPLCHIKPDFAGLVGPLLKLCSTAHIIRQRWPQLLRIETVFKGILSTTSVIFSYPKLLSFSVLTFIKWRLTPSYAAKDTIFWRKRSKTIVIRIIDLDDNIQIYSYGLLCEPVLSMRTV